MDGNEFILNLETGIVKDGALYFICPSWSGRQRNGHHCSDTPVWNGDHFIVLWCGGVLMLRLPRCVSPSSKCTVKLTDVWILKKKKKTRNDMALKSHHLIYGVNLISLSVYKLPVSVHVCRLMIFCSNRASRWPCYASFSIFFFFIEARCLK